jgi:hypothetical protein
VAGRGGCEARYTQWHDLRHTWASWHVQDGTPLPVLQELGGWESVEMVRRYTHLAANHLAPYADHLGTRWEVASQMCHGYGAFTAQPGKEKVHRPSPGKAARILRKK